MKKTVLCVDDHYHNLRLLSKILGDTQYNFLEATRGLMATELAEIHVPDIILLDINLPDIDGVEVFRRIRAHPELSHIPIIAVTANSMHGDREYLLGQGFDAYLPKPISGYELRHVVRNLE